MHSLQFSRVQSQYNSVDWVELSCIQLFVTHWTAAHQASMSATNSQSLFKLMSMSWWCHPTISLSVVPFSSCPQSFPALGSFQISHFFALGGQSIGVSASASVHPMNIQDWFPLGWLGWISLLSKGPLKSLIHHHSSKASILWCSVFFTVQLSHPYMTIGKTVALTIWTFVGISRGRPGVLVFPSLSEFSTVYCDPHGQRLWHSQ